MSGAEHGEPSHLSTSWPQDRVDLSSAARVVSQGMSSPIAGAAEAVTRIIRYIKKYPICVQDIEEHNIGGHVLCGQRFWAGDISTRTSYSGGWCRDAT